MWRQEVKWLFSKGPTFSKRHSWATHQANPRLHSDLRSTLTAQKSATETPTYFTETPAESSAEEPLHLAISRSPQKSRVRVPLPSKPMSSSCQFPRQASHPLKMPRTELPWWSGGSEPACQCGNTGPIPDPEDSTGWGATKPMHHNSWACALEP